MARVRIAVDEQGESLHLDTRIQHRGPLASLTHPLTPLRAACTWARGAFWSRRVGIAAFARRVAHARAFMDAQNTRVCAICRRLFTKWQRARTAAAIISANGLRA